MSVLSKITDFNFILRTNARFGVGKARLLHDYLVEIGRNKPGIIIDSSLVNGPYVKEIIGNIQSDENFKVCCWTYTIKGEPDYESLDKIKTEFLDNLNNPIVDCFIGIGGGSVIDFAKGLATVVVNPGDSVNYKGFPKDLNPSLPIIALPTTAGTGSEVTFNAVFTDTKMGKKLGINTYNNFPTLAILDPLLTVTCPPSVTASSGMDALVHTLESYAACQATPISRIFAREAFKLLFNNLQKVSEHPEDLDVRTNLQFGAYLAGISLINSGSGPAGALSYPLGVHFHVPHGIAGAVFIPYIIEHNVQNGYDYSELYDLIDDVDQDQSVIEKNRNFVHEVFKLAKKLQVPENLKAYGVNQNNINILLQEVESLEKAFAQNPVVFNVDDGKKLLMKLIKSI